MPFGLSHYRPDADGMPERSQTTADERKIGINKQTKTCRFSLCFLPGSVCNEELKDGKVLVNAD